MKKASISRKVKAKVKKRAAEVKTRTAAGKQRFKVKIVRASVVSLQPRWKKREQSQKVETKGENSESISGKSEPRCEKIEQLWKRL